MSRLLLLSALFCALNLTTAHSLPEIDPIREIPRLTRYEAHALALPYKDTVQIPFDTAALRAKLVYPASELMRKNSGEIVARIMIGPKGGRKLMEVAGEPSFKRAFLDAVVGGGLADTGRGESGLRDGENILVVVRFKVGDRGGKTLGLYDIVVVMPRKENSSMGDGDQPVQNARGSGTESEVYPDPDDFVPVNVMPTYDQHDLLRRVRYPEEARRAGIEGQVIVRALVDSKGKVVKTLIERSSSPVLSDAAVEAVKHTPFTPALEGNKPVAIWIQIPVIFKFSD